MLNSDDYRLIFEASPDGILIVAEDGTVVDVNARAETLFGYGRDELLGASVDLLVPESARVGHASLRHRYVRDPYARPMGAQQQLVGRRKDGTEVPVEISLSPLDRGGATIVICTVRDISERKRLRDFSVSAVRYIEEERQRIARELHDDTAQRLATLMLRVRLLVHVGSSEALEKELDELREQLLDATEGVKRIARGLRPPALDELGLVAALRAHIGGLNEATGLGVELDSDDGVDHLLDQDARLALYRIVQESLSNVVRHAGVSAARVEVRRTVDRVRLSVEDEGRGFLTSKAQDAGGGLGLMGMRERAVMLGGSVTIESEPGRGTKVSVELPTSEREPGHV